MPNNSVNTCYGYEVLNLTDETQAKEILFSASEQVVITVVLPCMLLLCLAGNCTFLFAVKRVRRLHTIINFYLVVLAIADIGYVLNGFVGYLMLYLTTPVRSDWPNGYECWISTSFGRLCYYISVGVMTIISLDRYIAICHPFEHRALNTKTRAIKLVTVTLAFGVLMSCSSAILGYGKLTSYCIFWPYMKYYDSFPAFVNFCSPIIAKGRVFYELLIVVPFFLALLVNGYMYCRIVRGLSHRHDTVKTVDANVKTKADVVRNQITRMLVISGLLFFLCQVLRRVASLHLILANTADYYIFTDGQYGIVVLVGRALLYLNSATNPYVYTAASSHYRKSFLEAFRTKNRHYNLANGLELESDKMTSTTHHLK